MKNLKNLSLTLLLLAIAATFASCKKDKDEQPDGSNNYTYGGKTVKIKFADYRSGNGDGAWIYFSSEDYADFVQIRFAGLSDYAIPVGTFSYKASGDVSPYNPARNFKGGQVIRNNVVEEFNGGQVSVSKNGDSYTITFEVKTAGGDVTGTFSGKLTKI